MDVVLHPVLELAQQKVALAQRLGQHGFRMAPLAHLLVEFRNLARQRHEAHLLAPVEGQQDTRPVRKLNARTSAAMLLACITSASHKDRSHEPARRATATIEKALGLTGSVRADLLERSPYGVGRQCDMSATVGSRQETLPVYDERRLSYRF
jgi:hypothetical protein